MNHENEMKSRRESKVRSINEGAAARQDRRSDLTTTAYRRAHRRSIAEQREEQAWGPAKTVAVCIAGTVLLYALMWLACAF